MRSVHWTITTRQKNYYEAGGSTIGLANVALRKGTVYADAAGYQEATDVVQGSYPTVHISGFPFRVGECPVQHWTALFATEGHCAGREDVCGSACSVSGNALSAGDC